MLCDYLLIMLSIVFMLSWIYFCWLLLVMNPYVARCKFKLIIIHWSLGYSLRKFHEHIDYSVKESVPIFLHLGFRSHIGSELLLAEDGIVRSGSFLKDGDRGSALISCNFPFAASGTLYCISDYRSAIQVSNTWMLIPMYIHEEDVSNVFQEVFW